MKTFSTHTHIYLQSQSIEQLQALPIQKALVVCDPFLTKNGMVDKVTQQLDARSAAWVIFDEILPDPTIQLVSEGVKAAMSAAPDTIIAMGGGSAIDAAKAINYIYTQTSKRPHPLCIAIPTTSGTGSEATSFSVISDPEAGLKYPLVSEEMLPQIALLCPELTFSVPPQVTADTGLDVLTHAFEAYVSTRATDFSDALAEKAVALTMTFLPRAFKNGADEDAREHLQNASCMAGIAFDNAGLGLCHSMAHALGAKLHLPHGRSNALLLPHIIRFNAEDPVAKGRYAALAKLLDCCSYSEEIAVNTLIRRLEALMAELKVAPRLAENLRAQAQESLEAMSAAALEDRCLADNPCTPTAAQVMAIYRKLL